MKKMPFLVFLFLILCLPARAEEASAANGMASATPSYTISIFAAAKKDNGDPKVGIAIDDQIVDTSMITASYLDDDWQEISLVVQPDRPVSRLALELLNKSEQKTNGREIYLKSITVNGVAIRPEDGVFQKASTDEVTPEQQVLHDQLVWSLAGVPATPPVSVATTASPLLAPIFYEPTFSNTTATSAGESSIGGIGGGGGSGGGSGGSSGSGGSGGSSGSSDAAVAATPVATPSIAALTSTTTTTTTTTTAPITYTIAGLAPALLNTLNFGNPGVLPYVPAQSPVTAVAGDTTQSFVAPDGTNVVVTIKSPAPTKTYTAPAMSLGGNPVTYFQQQFAAAGSTATTIVFPQATYNFPAIDCTNSADPNYVRAHIFVHNLQDVVVDWQGSTLNMSTDCMGIFVEHSTRTLFKNFIIDWPTLNNSAVGVVTSIGGTGPSAYTYNMRYPAGTVLTGGMSVGTAWDAVNDYWSLLDPQHEKYMNSTPVAIANDGTATNIPSGTFQMTVGESIVARHIGLNSAVYTYDNADTTIENATVYNSPSLGFLIGTGRGYHLNNVHVDRLAGRPISTMADAVHFGTFGGDIIIENSSFAYQGDDGLNIHTTVTPVSSMTCTQGSCPFTLPSTSGATYGTQTGDMYGLFDAQVNFIAARPSTCSGATCTVDVSPIASAGGYVMGLTASTERYIIQNNTYYHNRARGILAQSPYGLIQNNTLTGQSLWSISVVQNAPYWHEGPGAQDVLFFNNQISSPGTGGGNASVIFVDEGQSGSVAYSAIPAVAGVPPIPATLQNIIFANNSFSNLPGAAFYVSSANNVILYNNSFSNINQVTSTKTPNINGSVVIYDASNVFLSGNSLITGSGTAQTLSVLTNTSDGNITGSW